MLPFVLFGIYILYQGVICQINGPCVESNVSSSLFPFRGYQLAHFESKNSIYIFGGENSEGGFNNKIWKWSDTSQEPYFHELTNLTIPAEQFYSFTQNVVVLDNYAYFAAMCCEGGSIYRFDVNTESWESGFTPMPTPVTHGCVVTNNSHIFIVGGSTPSDLIQVYNIDSDEWNEYEFGISHGLDQSMCTMLNNNIFIFGGINDRSVTDTIYKVQWPENRWELVGYLPTRRRYICSAIVLHCDVNVILTGGNRGTSVSSTNIIQVFNIRKEYANASRSIYNANNASQISGVIVNNNMYVFAGNATICPLDATVCASRSENTWTIIGITLGCLVLIGIACWIFVRYRKKRKDTVIGEQNYKRTDMSLLLDHGK